VEHNLKSLLEIVDRVYVMDKGRVVASDSARKIITDGVLEKVFMGKL
jgi:ABC-type branched-subunit amino acid transport system ATPase component